MNASLKNTSRFESLYETYVSKVARLRELKANGRYGYQLRMPKVALRMAAEALKAEFPEEAKRLGVL